jgi:putative membrane protein
MAAFGFITTVKPVCDRDLTRKGEDGLMLGAALGERAAEQAESADVRLCGRMTANYDNLAGNRLLEIARNDNLAVSRDMDKADSETLRHLSELEGRDFDREYMNEVINGRKNTVKLFERMAGEAADPDLRDYARQTIPALREHLRTAMEIRGRIESRQ